MPKKAAPKKSKKKSASKMSELRSRMTAMLGEDQAVNMDSASLLQSIPHISTGSVALDYLIGGRENAMGVRPCPGVPRGRLTMIYGNPGAGKTTIALQTCASICADGGRAIYVDWENEVEPRYASVLGVPVSDEDKFLLIQPNTLEDGLKWMVYAAQDGVDLIVIDSIGAAVPKQMFEKQEGDAVPIGLNARKWSEYLPKLKNIVSSCNTAVIGISQLRAAIGGFGPVAPKPQGGKAWTYYNSLQIMLRVIGTEKGKVWDAMQGKLVDTVVGNRVRAKLDKCKVSDSLKHEVEFYLISGNGVDNTRTVIELGISTGVISKKGAWFSWHGPNGEIRGQGLNNFTKQLSDEDIGTIFGQTKPYLVDPNAKSSEEPPAAAVDDDDEDFVPVEEDNEDAQGAIDSLLADLD